MAKSIRIHDKQFELFLSSEKIQKAVNSIAEKISKDFKGKQPVFLSVLNGAFLFTADLVKKVNLDCEVSFIKVASYSGLRSAGIVYTVIGLNENLKGKHVIILEDIVDSGNTVEKIMWELKKHNPKKVSIATLIYKPRAYKKNMKVDYVGIETPNDFLVGYGLDYNGLGRNLSDIYILKS